MGTTGTQIVDTMALGASSELQQAPPGQIAPAEGPAVSETPYGEHNEKLPVELQQHLYRLVLQFSAENRWARRQEVRAARQARFFWRGFQYMWWSEKDQNFRILGWGPDSYTADLAGSDMPRYTYVTNLYQAFGLSIMAPLTQAAPHVRFFPEEADNPEDVATAKAATKVAKLIERNNRVPRLLEDEAYYAWTDGKVGAYVRYVADAERFGTERSPELAAGQATLADSQVSCPCGFATPATHFAPPVPCPQCGRPLTEENITAPVVASVPIETGETKIPRGQEIITIVGALELKTPILAGELHDYHFLTYSTEQHFSKLRAAYPWAAQKIHAGSPGIGEDTFERIARISVRQGTAFRTQTGDAYYNLVTLHQTWMRPYTFEMVEDRNVRDQLYQLFPDGCFVAFAGDTYLESRSESMDDHWAVMHALPGDGQNRPAIGESLISIQERFNDLANIMMETYEYGIPITWADDQAVDIQALQGQIAEPGSVQPVTTRAGESVGEKFYTPAPAELSPTMMQHATDLMGPIAQFITGAFPSLFGGNMEDQKTASAYSMARDQAMGRLGIVWRRMRDFHADIIRLGVDCFRENRAEDVQLSALGTGREYSAEWIRLNELKGNFTVHPESDENFPMLWTQQRGVYLQLLQQANNPIMAQLLADPDNQKLGKRLLGLTDLDIPDEGPRDKQRREIAALLEGRPADIDPQFDNHAVEAEVGKDWVNSDEGQAAKEDNPDGFMRVRQHVLQHMQIAAQTQQPEGKPPSKHVSMKDLPPEGQVQLAQQAGIKIGIPAPEGEETP